MTKKEKLHKIAETLSKYYCVQMLELSNIDEYYNYIHSIINKKKSEKCSCGGTFSKKFRSSRLIHVCLKCGRITKLLQEF